MTTLPQSNGKVCCIFIGSAGCGKSTLIESMCINDGSIKSGNSSQSVTKALSVVKHKKNNDLLLMDTIGCEDTDNVMTDDEILKQITHKLAKNGAPKVKIMWCIKPEDRQTPKLQKQAKFINALVQGKWEAVQIVVKKGTSKADSQGARCAAKKFTDVTLPLYDLHCLDRIENVKQNKMYKYCLKEGFDERSNDGFLYFREIDGIISKKINSLSSAKASLKKEFYHKKNGKLVPKMTHKGTIVEKWEHWGFSEMYTISSSRGCPKGHTDLEYCKYRAGSWVSNWYCVNCRHNIRVGTNFYHCFDCCDRGKRNGHRKIVKRCAGMYCTSCGQTIKNIQSQRYSCCHRSYPSSSGCTPKLYYNGCGHNKKDTNFCKEDYKYWNCCKTKEGEKLNRKCGDWKWVPENFG